MSHYTLCSIAQIDSEETYKEFQKLCQSQQNAMIDFFTEKLKKPLSRFDINDGKNEKGKFDYYSIFSVMTSKDLLDHLSEFDRMPDSILLPDLKWIQSKEAIYFVTENNQRQFDEWIKEFRAIISSYGSSIVALIDCHI